MNVLNRIKLKISRGEIAFSEHLLSDKLPLYDFTAKDVIHAVNTCENVIKQTDDIRGVRYVILGYARNGVPVDVVCRFVNEKVFFLTIYDYA
jgi:hypothetical protein